MCASIADVGHRAAVLEKPKGAVEVTYRLADGTVRRDRLVDVAAHPFHLGKQIRVPRAHREQRNLPGYAWLASTGTHVFYESRLELSILLKLDFDRVVEAVLAQPFYLHFAGRAGRGATHVPDFFVLRKDGRGLVIDVTLEARRSHPTRRLQFELTERACARAGWRYAVESELEPTFLANLHALAGFRREPAFVDRYEQALLDACRVPRTIVNSRKS